jgi:hypothetical protein
MIFTPVEALNGLECPLTLELMEDPVIAADGHSYEREAIIQHFAVSGPAARSPITNLPFPNQNLIPNHALRKSINDHRARSGLANAGQAQAQQIIIQATQQLLQEFTKIFNSPMAALPPEAAAAGSRAWDPQAPATHVALVLRALRRGSLDPNLALMNPALIAQAIGEEFPAFLNPTVHSFLQMQIALKGAIQKAVEKTKKIEKALQGAGDLSTALAP